MRRTRTKDEVGDFVMLSQAHPDILKRAVESLQKEQTAGIPAYSQNSLEDEFFEIYYSDKGRSARGGKRSGESRRQKSEDEWRAIARTKAKHLRGQKPTLSQDDLASEIIAIWPNHQPPGHRSVKALISEMEKAGQLAARA